MDHEEEIALDEFNKLEERLGENDTAKNAG